MIIMFPPLTYAEYLSIRNLDLCEVGLEYIEHMSMSSSENEYYRVVDNQKFMLGIIKYGFKYEIVQ